MRLIAINKLIEDSVEFYKHFQGYASFKNFMLEDEKLNISNDLLDAMLVGVKTQEDLWGK